MNLPPVSSHWRPAVSAAVRCVSCRKLRPGAWVWAACTWGLLSGSAWAALGGDAASVLADQQAMAASASTSYLAGTTLHTQTLPNGVTVRQYVDAAGHVFALGWEGPVPPDLQRLLGTHFAAYQEAMRQQRRGVQLHSATLVLESGGMMRAFFGRAYLPGQVPAALDAQSIR